jgi:hypothetical protein
MEALAAHKAGKKPCHRCLRWGVAGARGAVDVGRSGGSSLLRAFRVLSSGIDRGSMGVWVGADFQLGECQVVRRQKDRV